MTESLNVTVDRRDGLAVIYTEGYINNQGGEEIAKEAYKLLDDGYKRLLLNLAGTKIVNSIGISILIEIIEKMLEIDGKLGFCCLTPTIEKTFHIMGLAQYAPIFKDEEAAVRPDAGLTRRDVMEGSVPAGRVAQAWDELLVLARDETSERQLLERLLDLWCKEHGARSAGLYLDSGEVLEKEVGAGDGLPMAFEGSITDVAGSGFGHLRFPGGQLLFTPREALRGRA